MQLQNKTNMIEQKINSSTCMNCITVPTGPPTDVTASDVAARSFKMSWEDLTCDDLGGETLRYSYELTSRFGIVSDETPLKSVTFLNLRCGTEYTFRVAAITADGVGPLSDGVIVKTLRSEGKYIIFTKILPQKTR